MGNNLKFNSSVCTSIEQSQRLLELGLKPETADMCIDLYYEDEPFVVKGKEIDYSKQDEFIPAWSLYRLVQLMPPYLHLDKYMDTQYYLTLKPSCFFKVLYRQDSGRWIYGSELSNLYDAIIDVIEFLIFGNQFNKQYLKQ